MAERLTEGSISAISTGKWQATNVKPVVQVLDIRQLETKTVYEKERYRVRLSDGSFYRQGMLATQLNDLVRSRQLQRGYVLQLNDFVLNLIRDRMIIIIVEVNVILSNCDIIGDPKSLPSTPGSESSTSRSLATMLPVQPTYYQPLPMYMNIGPIAKNNEAPPMTIAIAALNPYQDRWTIKARVTAKAELIHYNDAKGDNFFSFDVIDSDGSEIRATCFNAVADKFYDQIKVGKVYFISKGNVKPAQKTFNHLNSDHEITLDRTSTIQPCLDMIP